LIIDCVVIGRPSAVSYRGMITPALSELLERVAVDQP
jgi:hypothetical protein